VGADAEEVEAQLEVIVLAVCFASEFERVDTGQGRKALLEGADELLHAPEHRDRPLESQGQQKQKTCDISFSLPPASPRANTREKKDGSRARACCR
jgi:hypothetical protein